MKNYVKDDQKLPIYGIGPYLVITMGILTVIGIVLSGNVLESGIMEGTWVYLFRVMGALFIAIGIYIWMNGAVRSDIDADIADNKLKTDGIFACVRNPMYSGFWFLFLGISLMWHNAWLIVVFLINWMIMTVVLKNTEEKWLQEVYGDDYIEYKKHVNRCVPILGRMR